MEKIFRYTPATSDAKEWYRKVRYMDARDRIFLEKEYLPTLQGSVLYVGVGSYTAFYHKLVKDPTEFETIDVLKEVAHFGSPNRHWIGDIRDLAAEYDVQYNHVALYGNFGFGKGANPPTVVATKLQIIKCLEAADELLLTGGTLLVAPGMVDRTAEFWDEVFNTPFLKKNYKILLKKQMDTYIWWAQKRA